MEVSKPQPERQFETMTTPAKPKIQISEFTDIAPDDPWDRPTRKSNRAPKPRSERQLSFDGKAAELYAAWVKADKPRDMDKSPKTHVRVNPEGVDAVVSMIRKTAQPAGGVPGKSVRVRIGDVQASGRVTVTFAVWDRAE
jgi:hypothetical protein